MGRPIGGGGNIVLGMNGDNGQYVGGLSRTSVGGGYGSQQGGLTGTTRSSGTVVEKTNRNPLKSSHSYQELLGAMAH